jgi:thioredoxin reductase (NADPH)
MEQIKQFEPGFTLENAETIDKQEDGSFIVTLIKDANYAAVVAIKGGLEV